MPPLPPEAMVEGGSAGYGSGPAGNYTGSGTGPRGAFSDGQRDESTFALRHSYRGPLPPTAAWHLVIWYVLMACCNMF